MRGHLPTMMEAAYPAHGMATGLGGLGALGSGGSGVGSGGTGPGMGGSGARCIIHLQSRAGDEPFGYLRRARSGRNR